MAHGPIRSIGTIGLLGLLPLALPSAAAAQGDARAAAFVAFAPALPNPAFATARSASRRAPAASPFGSRCDYRGEGLIGGLALGIVLAAARDASAGEAALQVGFGAAGGWLFGRFLVPPKRGCDIAATMVTSPT